MIINWTHRSILLSFEIVLFLFRATFPRILSAAVSRVSSYLYKEITKKVLLYPWGKPFVPLSKKGFFNRLPYVLMCQMSWPWFTERLVVLWWTDNEHLTPTHSTTTLCCHRRSKRNGKNQTSFWRYKAIISARGLISFSLFNTSCVLEECSRVWLLAQPVRIEAMHPNLFVLQLKSLLLTWKRKKY